VCVFLKVKMFIIQFVYDAVTSCSPIPHVSNGDYVVADSSSSCTSNDQLHLTVCTLKCDAGYVITSYEKLKCFAKEWNTKFGLHKIGSCERKSFCAVGSESNYWGWSWEGWGWLSQIFRNNSLLPYLRS